MNRKLSEWLKQERNPETDFLVTVLFQGYLKTAFVLRLSGFNRISNFGSYLEVVVFQTEGTGREAPKPLLGVRC